LLPDLPFDLHVLGLPLAFILSQDQTLHCNNPSAPYGTRSTYSPPHFRVIERQSNVCLSLTRIRIPFKELQKRIATSLVHKTYPLSSNVLRVRYQLSIIQRTSCPVTPFPLIASRDSWQMWSRFTSESFYRFPLASRRTRSSGDLRFTFPFLLQVPPRTEPVSFWECKGKRYLFFFQLLQPKFFAQHPPPPSRPAAQNPSSKGLQNYHLKPSPQIFTQLFFPHSVDFTRTPLLFRFRLYKRNFIAISASKQNSQKWTSAANPG
jgi:hypothetical protein